MSNIQFQIHIMSRQIWGKQEGDIKREDDWIGRKYQDIPGEVASEIEVNIVEGTS